MEGLEGWLGDENTEGVGWQLGIQLLLDLTSRSSRSSTEERTEAKEEEISLTEEEEDSTSSSALLSFSCGG